MSVMSQLRWPATMRLDARSANGRVAETLVGIALAVWVFGRLVFAHSDVGTLPAMPALKPMAYVEALVFGCAVAVISMREVRMDAVGFVALGLLLATALIVRTRLKDPSLLVFALLLAASKGMRFSRLVLFGLVGVAGGVILVAAIRMFPTEFAGANRHTLARLHFAGNQMVPRLAFESLACLFLVSWICRHETKASAFSGYRFLVSRKRLCCALFVVGCALLAVVSAVRYGSRRYALLILLLGVCVIAYAVWQSELDAGSKLPWIRLAVAVAPPLLCCVLCDFVAYYKLSFMDVETGAYVSFVRNYGLLPFLLVVFLYARTVLTIDEEMSAFPLLVVFTLYGLALAFDADAAFLEMNLPLLLLSAGLEASDSGGCVHD